MIKIYVACLASYNNGFLHGKWFDLSQFSDADDLREAITNEVLEDAQNPTTLKYGEKCEEFAIHDFEAPKGCEIGEYSGLEELMEMNEILSDDNGEVIVSLKSHLGGGTTLEQAKDYFEENHCGEFKSDTDFAEEMAKNCFDADAMKSIGRYFDYESYARDLMFDYFEIDGHYFRSA